MTSKYVPHSLLITGGAGFIGSHVVELLVRKYPDYRIVVLDCLDYCASIKNLDSVKGTSNMKFVRGDIASIDLIRYIIETERIDTIMHFAAQSHVDLSFGNSVKFTETNIVGTHMLLEASRAAGGQIKRFVHVSTDEVYGENEEYACKDDVKMETTSPLDPTNPYAASKAAAEMLVKSYGRSFGLPYVITRGNNVYGPRQFPEKLIPKMVMMLCTGKKLTVHGEGLAKRSYLHVDDVAAAFDCVLHNCTASAVCNIGTTAEQTVISTVQEIIQLLRPGADSSTFIQHVRDRNFNDSRYFVGTSVLDKLGWKQRIDFGSGLKQTVAWYVEHGQKYWTEGVLNSVLVPHPVPGGVCDAEVPSAPGVEEHQPPAKKQKTAVKFLVFGRNGWIGGMVGQLLSKQGYEFEWAKSRMENRESVERELLGSGCTHAMNAAGTTGRPNVDWCETHRPETIRANVIGTLTLADLCHKHGIHMTNFATGCIFHYDEAHPEQLPRDQHFVAKETAKTFTEESRPNFTGSYYSETKGYVENMLREYDNICTLRVRMPIDADITNNKRNFIYKIATYTKVVNIPNSMTVLDELIPYAIELALRKRTGIYNFTNPGAISHNQVLELYKEYVDASFTWQNFTVEEQAQVITAQRSNNELSPQKLQAEFPQMLAIRDSLIKYVFEPARAARASKVA